MLRTRSQNQVLRNRLQKILSESAFSPELNGQREVEAPAEPWNATVPWTQTSAIETTPTIQ